MKISLCLISCFIAGLAYSQKIPVITLQSGEVSSLSSVKELSVVYNYDGMKVNDFATEQEYLNDKKAQYVDKPKGYERFERIWYEVRKEKFEPYFLDGFAAPMKKVKIKAKNSNESAPVIMLVQTLYLSRGYNSDLNLKITFTDRSGKELAQFTVTDVRAEAVVGFESYDGVRSSYWKAGRSFGQDLAKRIMEISK